MPAPRNRRHIFVLAQPSAEPFRPYGRKITPSDFRRPLDRPAHAANLVAALNNANQEALHHRELVGAKVPAHEPGIYIEFVAAVGADLQLDSLDLKGSGIRLLAVRDEQSEGTTRQ